MLKLKHRKIIFLILITLLAGGSMVSYGQSEVNFWSKTFYLIFFQQFSAIAIYLVCFCWDWLPLRSSQNNLKEISNKMPFSQD
jgi:hypothetical protein